MKYADIRTNLNVHPISGDLLRFIDEDAISSQIKNLIFIDTYEIFWNPTVGAGLPQTLFDNFGYDSEQRIKTRISETINKYVNRAKLIDVIVKYDGNNGYAVTIVYRPLNQIDPITLQVILTRTR